MSISFLLACELPWRCGNAAKTKNWNCETFWLMLLSATLKSKRSKPTLTFRSLVSHQLLCFTPVVWNVNLSVISTRSQSATCSQANRVAATVDAILASRNGHVQIPLFEPQWKLLSTGFPTPRHTNASLYKEASRQARRGAAAMAGMSWRSRSRFQLARTAAERQFRLIRCWNTKAGW